MKPVHALWIMRVLGVALFATTAAGMWIALSYRHLEMLPSHLGLAGLLAWVVVMSARARVSISLRGLMVLLVLLCSIASGRRPCCGPTVSFGRR